MNSDIYRLLALAARTKCETNHYHLLARQAVRLRDWSEVPARAEAHGVAPLVYVHLKAAGVQPPRTVKRELQGLYLRHRDANQVRTQVLRDILTAYQSAGIPALVLKGIALAHLVYPEPGLRSMSDLDILVPKAEARRAQGVLAELGFNAPLPPNDAKLPGKHLAVATQHIDGILVSVEIHHNLFNIGTPVSMEIDDLTVAPRPFSLATNDTTSVSAGLKTLKVFETSSRLSEKSTRPDRRGF